jgi:hypothetical protein
MPFCRECRKEVQDDWITCPFCSKPIGPPAVNNVALSDSVVMGNITTINDSDSISSAVQSASKCISCGSIGTTQLACIVCKKIAHCSICKDEIYSQRFDSLNRSVDSSETGIDEREAKTFSQNRMCHGCYPLELEKKYCNCTQCGRYFIFENLELLESNFDVAKCRGCINIFGSLFD